MLIPVVYVLLGLFDDLNVDGRTKLFYIVFLGLPMYFNSVFKYD